MVKVIIQECPDYELIQLTDKINTGIAALGGWDKYIRPGMKVLLKVNLIGPKTSETAAVTHAEFVRALIRILKAKDCIVWIGDSAGGSIAGIAPTARAFEVSGLKKVAGEENVQLKNFDREGVTAVPSKRNPSQTIYLAKPLFDADVVINLPKLKTHMSGIYTGAVKNAFGCIPGLRKAEYHKNAPSPRQLGEVLADIHECSKIALHIMDAVTAMDGKGPTAGNVYPAKKILISADPLALDTVATRMINLDICNIPIFDAARSRKLGASELAEIQITGDYQTIPSLPSFKVPKLTSNGDSNSKILGKIIDFLKTRPVVNLKDCKNCQVCVASCPVKAIDSETKKIDYSKCIECLCCHELCMHQAVRLKYDNCIAAILMGLSQLKVFKR